MRGAIAVFVKTPGLSPVKTRLASALGKEKAEAFHLLAAKAVQGVLQAVSQLTQVQGYYAVAEPSALNHRYWQELPCVWQGEGGLGERMAQVYHTLLAEHDYVILVGADIPQMTTLELLSAANWLAKKGRDRLVFGPSEDGGFWALGGNCKIAQAIWTEVVYSQADTGQQFFNRVRKLGEMKTLACMRDVDELGDLRLLRETLRHRDESLVEQDQLMRFLDDLCEQSPDSFSP